MPFFLPSSASRGHVEATVSKYVGRGIRVTETKHQGREGFLIHASGVSKSVLEDIQSEVQNGRRNERNSASREADHTSDYLEHGVMPSRRRPASDLSSAIHGQSYSMRHPAIPEHRAVANADGEPLSRHTSRTESVYSGYGRDHQDADSMYGSLPSLYGSPTLSISKMATQPIAIPANQRRPSGVSEGSENSFDDMYGCQQSPRLAGPQSYSNSSRDRHQSFRHEDRYRRQ